MKSRVLLTTLIAITCGILLCAATAPAAIITVDGSGGADYTTIQAAITAASPSDTIQVAAGTYAETVVVDKVVTLTGAGSGVGDTVIAGSLVGNGLTVSASGADAAHRLEISGLRITGFVNGLTTGGSHLQFTDIASVGNSNYGLNLGNGSDLVFDGCDFGNNKTGIKLSTTGSVDGFQLLNSTVDNCEIGMYIAAASGGASNFEDVLVRDCSFSDCQLKGLYIEKLSDAIFENLVVDNSGWDSSYDWAAGVDINLKYRADYADISFVNPTITNCGVGALHGVGITIKARDDGGYAASPASLDGVTIDGGTISGNEVGVRFGEPGQSNAGPTGVTVTQVSFSANDGLAVENETSASLEASGNYWGSEDPDFSTLVGGSGPVTVDTWYTDAGMTQLSAGFDNPRFGYTQVWASGSDSYGRWPDYHAATGRICWRDLGGNGYVADFDPATATLSNVTMFSTTVYDLFFSSDGSCILFQDDTTTTTQIVTGGTIDAYPCKRYEIAGGAVTTVFDISTVPPANIEAVTAYTGTEFGFYIGAGATDDELLMSVRDVNGQMDVMAYSISAKTFVNLTASSSQAEYDGSYLGPDASRLLYWTESHPGHKIRGVAILAGGGETVLDSVDSDDPGALMYLGVRWGQNADQVFGVKGTSFASNDLMMFAKSSGSWSAPEDMTGPGWNGSDYSDGGVYPGASASNGVLFGVRNSGAANGLWYAVPVTMYVDRDYDGSTPGFGVDHYDTIQDAIDAAAPGATIEVAAGTYDEQLEISKTVTIHGAGAGSTIVRAYASMPLFFTTSSANYPLVYVHGVDDVVIENLTVDGDGQGNTNYRFSGIAFYDAGGTVEDVTVVNVSDTPPGGAQHGVGIYAYNDVGTSREVTVRDCVVSGFQKTGIALSGEDTVALVEGCVVTGAGPIGYTAQNGIQIGFGASGEIRGNTVSDIEYTGSSWGATGILGVDPGAVTVADNVVADCGGGLRMDDYSSPPHSGPIVIENNTFDGNAFNTVWGCENVVVTGNSFDGCSEGLWVIDSNNVVCDDNSFDGNVYGLIIDGACDGVDISGCSFGGNTEIGLVVEPYNGGEPVNITVDTSLFVGNGTAGIENAAAATVDVSGNYWGDPSGPSGAGYGTGDAMGAGTTYSNWYGDTALTDLREVIDGSGYATIQAAIDAADVGDCVLIAAGTYPENVTIYKELILVGAGAASTVIDGGGSGTVCLITADDVRLSGFTVRNSGATTADGGIGLVDVDGCDVFDCTVTANTVGIGLAGSSSNSISDNTVSMDGYGIALDNAEGVGGAVTDGSTDNIITGNVVDQNVVFGIYIAENCHRTEVTDNTVTGSGETGLFFWKSSDNTVTGNEVSDNVVDGVHIFGSADNVITDNVVTGNDVGFEIRSGVIGSSGNLLQGNVIAGNLSYGVSADGNDGNLVDAPDNWWGDPSGPYDPVGTIEVPPCDGVAGVDMMNTDGLGADIVGVIDCCPWEATPPVDNVLYLVPTAPSLFIRPGESILVKMEVANLQQMVQACQAVLGYSSTYFDDPTAGAVAKGGGVWDELIWDSWATGSGIPGEIDTAIGVELVGSPAGTDADATVATIALTSLTGVEGVTRMVFRDDVSDVENTWLADMSAEEILPAKLDSAWIYIDGTAPTVDDVALTEYPAGTVDLTPAGIADQGDYDVTVTVSDDNAGIDWNALPTITVVDSAAAPLAIGSVTADPEAGAFVVAVTVDGITASGTATITVDDVTDMSGNVAATAVDTFEVSKTVVGQVELEALDPPAGGIVRTVTFVATGGVAPKSWDISVSFAEGVAIGDFTLEGVPDGTTGMSAKTAWNLRSKVSVALSGPAPETIAFTGADLLPGGDLNGSNSVNILDYSVMRLNWYTTNDVADIDGDGEVNMSDYDIMKLNWFTVGDAE